MAHFDELYQVWNIIGYTGKLNEAPTVYFMTDTEHGRITQVHQIAENIGREMPSSNNGYQFFNGISYEHGANERLIETKHGRIVHVSRNKLIRVDGDQPDMAAVNILAQAIWAFPNMKPMYRGYFRNARRFG